MKILYVTPYLCYPEAPYAGEITHYKLIEHLFKRGHDIFLISGLREPNDRRHIQKVEKFCTVLKVIDIPGTFRERLNEGLNWLKKGCKGGLSFRKKVAIAVQRYASQYRFDIIQIEHTEIGEYIKRPLNTPVIIDAHDVLMKPAFRKYINSKGIKKLKSFLDYRSVKKKEAVIYRRFDKVYTRSKHDKTLLSTIIENTDISVLPPYVRLKEFNVRNNRRNSHSILFVGAMDREVNVQAAKYFYKNVFPLVVNQIHDTIFYVVGNNPPAEIQELSSKDSQIIITGFVEDIISYYEQASVFVAPLFIGGGVIVKILDAMASGLPVVATSIANEGIEADAGKEILIADEPVKMAQKIVDVLQDEFLWKSISDQGVSFVARKFNWNNIIETVEKDYLALITSKRAHL